MIFLISRNFTLYYFTDLYNANHAYDSVYLSNKNEDIFFTSGSDFGKILIVYDINKNDGPIAVLDNENPAGDPDCIILDENENYAFIANGVAGLAIVKIDKIGDQFDLQLLHTVPSKQSAESV